MSVLKKCINCGAIVSPEEDSCPICGSIHFEETDAIAEPGFEPAAPAQAPVPQGSENVAAGIAGAFLFGLIGAAVYFGIYQLGYIAGICGFIIFFLANFGYGLFCGKKDSVSAARIVTCIVITIVMIFLAEYVSVAFDIYRAFKEEGETMSFVDVLRALPNAFTDKEFVIEFMKELGIALAMAALAIAANVAKMIKDRKARR
ncbi:MAG: hypothetical protein IKG85_02210 [Clostridia bacterium]|nr:hypothetical protein [Clostridia bacterium]